MANIWTADPFIYQSTASGVSVYDLPSGSLVTTIAYSTGVTSLWANDSHLYMGTTDSGVYRCPVNTITGTPTITSYKSVPDITSNYVNYIHGNGDYLCVTTTSGVNQYNLNTGVGICTTVSGSTKCYQTESGEFYYTTNPFMPISGLDSDIHGWDYIILLTLSGSITVDGYQYYLELPTSIYQDSQLYGEDIRFIQSNGVVAPHYIETWESLNEFTAMHVPAKSVIIDCISNYGGIDVGIRSVDFYLNGNKITVIDEDITCYASSFEGSPGTGNGWPHQAFITSLSKIGSSHQVCWQSNTWDRPPHRLICVFNDPTLFDEIRINNFHSYGGDTGEGAQEVKIYISTDNITNTSYNSAIANSTMIFYGILHQHTNSDIEDEQIITPNFTMCYNDGTVPPKVWVKCSANIDKLYMLYGNATIGSTSNIDGFFELYDDFNNDSLDMFLWNFDNGGVTDQTCIVSDGKATFTTTSNSHRVTLSTINKYDYGILETRLRRFGGSSSDMDFYFGWSGGTYCNLGVADNSQEIPHRIVNTGQSNLKGSKLILDTFKTHELIVNHGYQQSIYDGETLTLYDTISLDSYNVVFSYDNSSGAPDLQIDWVRLRKYMENVPSYTVGPKQLVSDLFEKAKLHAVYDNTSDWETDITSSSGGYTYNNSQETVFEVSNINDLYVTEDTSVYGGNVIFMATSDGGVVIEEKRGDEINCNKKIYLLET